MGTLLPEPEPGPACPLCWGSADSPFGSGQPPELLVVSVGGIRKGSGWRFSDGEPPAGVYSIPSSGSCFWTDFVPGRIWYDVTDLPFGAFARSSTDVVCFSSTPDNACQSHHGNDLIDPDGRFFGGTFDILL